MKRSYGVREGVQPALGWVSGSAMFLLDTTHVHGERDGIPSSV